jgi:PAS domain S-box-containing protein
MTANEQAANPKDVSAARPTGAGAQADALLAMMEAERVLQEILEREEALVEASSDGLIIVTGDGVIERANSSALLLFGYGNSEIAGERLELLVPGALDAMHSVRSRTPGSDLVTGEADANRETLGRRKGGAEILISIAFSQFYTRGEKSVIAVIRDLTQQKWHERELRRRTHEFQESERRYRLMFQNNPIPMWVTNRDSLTFLAVNDAALSRYGYTESEFLKLRACDIRMPEDVVAWLEYMKRVRNSPATHKRLSRHVTSSGQCLQVTTTHFRIEWDGKNAELVMVCESNAEVPKVNFNGAASQSTLAVDYDEVAQTLTVTAVSGEMRRYLNVPREFGAQMFAASSLDEFVKRELDSGTFQCTLLQVADEPRPSTWTPSRVG